MYPKDTEADLLSKMKTLDIHRVPTQLKRIPVDQLHPGPWQFRREFSEESINEMASSLSTGGINFNPLVVCPRNAGGYYIICGERRWKGATRAMLGELECKVGDYNHAQALFIAIADNIQREEFNPIEEARAYKELVEGGKRHEDIAKAVGRSRGHVSNYLRLLELDIAVRDMLIRGSLLASHARLLCSLESHTKQREIATAAVRGQWSYLKLQTKINEILNKPKPSADLTTGDPDIARLERIISEHTGYNCIIRKTAKNTWQAGFLMTSNEQFAGLLERMGIDVDL
jgi:ParB family transcriptional regulator, chromosome partitioning protein